MDRIPVFCVLFLALIVIGDCIELKGEGGITIPFQDQKKEAIIIYNSNNPVGQEKSLQDLYPGKDFDTAYNEFNKNYGTVANYPSQGSTIGGSPSDLATQVPLLKIPPRPEVPDHNESSEGNNLGGGTSTSDQVLGFTMTSDVAGTGRFATWSCLGGQKYRNKAHQLMSAISGDLTQSSELRYSVDRLSDVAIDSGSLDYAQAKIDKNDSILFVGQSYNDITELKNNDDLIQDDIIRAGAISKTSAYSSQSLKVNIEDEINNTELINNYIIYNTNTRFVGSSNLHAITNGTEIDQFYSGQFAIDRSIVSQLRFSNITAEDSWLDCCFGGYLTMPKNYQMGSMGFGSDLRTLFDCTCSKWKQTAEFPLDSGLTPIKVGKY